MIWINMFFNVLLSTSALIGYFSKFPLIYTNFIKYASVCYFVEDSLMEIGLYKRYIPDKYAKQIKKANWGLLEKKNLVYNVLVMKYGC